MGSMCVLAAVAHSRLSDALDIKLSTGDYCPYLLE
jgi:hypothetical protein